MTEESEGPSTVVPQERPVSVVDSNGQQPGEGASGSLDSGGSPAVETVPAVPVENVAATAAHSSAMPPPVKRFNAVNINKKFLEKTSASGAGSGGSGGGTKASPAVVRPSPPNPPPPSRLVTAKLTTTLPSNGSQSSWNKPSSSTPPAPAASTTTTPPAATTLPATRSPQPRAAVPSINRNGSPNGSKPAWGGVNNVGSNARPLQSEFPTAAEAAQSRAVKTQSSQAEADATLEKNEKKLAMLETASSFRGQHLDPNAHHWDEMEDEDSDFLDAPLEFGDGKQYKVNVDGKHPEPPPPSDAVSKKDRFADDDFDRSWPPRSSPAAPPRDLPPHTGHPAPPALFNERSNRLEPYAHNNRSVPTGPRRDQDSETSRRDPPPHAMGTSTSRGGHHHSRGGPPRSFNDENRGRPGPGSSSSFRERSRDSRTGPARDSLMMPPPPVPTGRASSREGRDQVRRPSFGAAPPVGVRDRSRDSVRQLPPHLRTSSSSNPSVNGHSNDHYTPRMGPDHPRHSQGWAISPNAPTVSLPTHSPVASVGSNLSPTTENSSHGLDLGEFHKLAMHSAAERARRRREEEEEERNRQRERAHKKAQELEQKIAAANAEKEKAKREQEEKETAEREAKAREAAEREVQEGAGKDQEPRNSTEGSHTTASAFRQPISTRPTQATRPAPRPPPLSDRTESWRSKAGPLPPVPVAVPPPPPVVTISIEAQSLADSSTANIEVVDFSELGKLVGQEPTESKEEQTTTNASQSVVPSKIIASRPVASDYFGDRPPPRDPPVLGKSDIGPWRRGSRPISAATTEAQAPAPASNEGQKFNISGRDATSLSNRPPAIQVPSHPPSSTIPGESEQEKRVGQRRHAPSISSTDGPSTSPTSTTFPSHTKKSSQEHGQYVTFTPNTHHSSRSPRTPNDHNKYGYREAPMSALTDTMSRIKGALDVMQSHDTSSDSKLHDIDSTKLSPITSPGRSKTNAATWREPILSGRDNRRPFPGPKFVTPTPQSSLPEEPFETTRQEVPHSSVPAEDTFVVRLPKISVAREAVPFKRLLNFQKPPASFRMEFLSWDPPVPQMSKKSLSRDELFFRPPPTAVHGPVVLPKIRLVNKKVPPRPENTAPTGPRVNLPGTAPFRSNGAFGASSWSGRGRGSDEASWRRPPSIKPSSSQTENDVPPELSSGPQLNTVSRSPPPEPPTPAAAISLPRSAPEPSGSPTSTSSARSRTQPKLPNGTDIGFYCGPVSSGEDKNQVQFTVTSELESGPAPAEPIAPIPPLLESSKSSETQSQSSNPDRLTTPPPSHPWGKSPLSLPKLESPARSAPDPEHLKIVWSQGTEEDAAATGNSLKDIADEFPATIPASVQDMKSEDGDTKGTPSPVPANAAAQSTRMSMHDAHRAFQQVPPGQPPPPRPAPFAAPPATAPPSTTPQQPIQGIRPGQPGPPARPHYMPPYGSPMMGHVQPPMAMMYAAPSPYQIPPSPAQHRLASSWVPMPAPPAPQPQFMRGPPGTAPYPPPHPQMIPYPSFPPPMTPTPQLAPVPPMTPVSRPVLSPAMPHAGVVPPQPQYPLPGAGRGTMRGPPPPAPPGGAVYNSVPSASFARPTW